ncbi:MAG: Fe-S-containing protein [Ignavibacteriae bacterium]|nr:Fe-S-containing protein [Ignavibacteriota bacterium]
MLESLIITLREGVEVALIVGLLIIYLNKIGRQELKRTVYASLGAALVVSVVVAFVLEALAMDFELFEGWLMFIAAAFVTGMVVWMWRTGKYIKKEIEERVDTLVAEKPTRQLQIGIFLFSFLMVVREGVETVIFLSAVTSAGAAWGAPLGALAGAAIAVVFGFMFVRGSMRIDIGRFLKVTAVVLLIFVAQLLVNGTHEFFELGVFPASPEAMRILGPIVRNNLLFILAIVSIPAIMFIIPARKKAEPELSLSRGWQIAAGVTTLSVVLFLGFTGVYTSTAEVRINPPVAVYAEDGIVHVPVTELLDGTLHRYAWEDEDGTQIRFFALRTPEGKFATAFDACRACYNYGYYYLDSGELICSVCEAPSEMTKLAVATEVEETQTGSMEGLGCAPLYLASRLQSGDVTVKVDDLWGNKKYFQTSHVPLTVTVVPQGERRKDAH